MGFDSDVIIVGCGIAGLVCASKLHEAGVACRAFEASDQVGGRIRTDRVDGFLLDRGFQVFLTAYPEAQAILDYEALELCRFEPGALIRFRGRFHRLSDPWRRPHHALATLFAKVGTLTDKLRIAGFRKHTTSGTLKEIYGRPEQTTIALLSERGFSKVVIERFFRPFLGGVFLNSRLSTSSRMCEFVFRMFSQGDAALPREGMQEIPKQLASRLPVGMVRTNSPVSAVDRQHVLLESGERLSARAIVVATSAPIANQILGDVTPDDSRSVSCLYFAADAPPTVEPILILNGDGAGPINNLCVPSQVSPSYAPQGKSLLSVTVLGQHADNPDLEADVRTQLQDWFGNDVDLWQHLKTYDIPYGLPDQSPPTTKPGTYPLQVRDRVFVCGDHCDTASINGAMASGRRAAESVIELLNRDIGSTQPANAGGSPGFV